MYKSRMIGDKMKDIIELEGREYQSHRIVCQRFGIDPKTVKSWVKNGTLPKPVKPGWHDYYDMVAVKRRALAASHLKETPDWLKAGGVQVLVGEP
jgi:hypothetical protein